MAGAFDLLETLRWTPGRGFFLLDRHLERMARSARHFGFVCDTASLREALDAAVSSSAGTLRVRLLLSRDGVARVECAILAPLASPAHVVLARAPIGGADELLRHKTTNRTIYEDARRVEPAGGEDDVILWNADRQITESTIANVVVEVGGRKLTPPVACGLLPGTFRAHLLEAGEIDEGIVTIDALQTATRLWLINSVREWWPAELLPQTTAAIASAPTSASAINAPTTNRSQR